MRLFTYSAEFSQVIALADKFEGNSSREILKSEESICYDT